MNGLYLIKPTSIASTGTSATISANGSVSFTAVSSLSLNGVFSADYDNYMIVWRASNTAATAVNIRMRSSGTDATGSNYTYQSLLAGGTSVSGSRATTISAVMGAAYATQRAGAIHFMYGPFLTQPTAMRCVTAADASSAYIYDHANTHSLSTSYDGFTAYLDAGTFTGLLGVYGMVK